MSLRVKDLHFSYNRKDVLSEVNLYLKGGNLVGLVGPNGSGKSTLLKNLDRILTPKKGSVLLNGKSIVSMKRRDIARRIGYVPQSTGDLFSKTVFDTVLMGRIPHGSWAPTGSDLRKVSDVLVEFGLQDLSDRDTNSLSGGQKQKVSIARAVAQEPEVLLLDEPTSALDLANQIDVMELIKKQTEKGILAVMAVHDLNLALRYCDRFVLLKAGKVVAKGDSEALSREVLEEVYEIKAKVLGNGKEKVL
ncbi:MAG: ABC transporter ATP-binding protein, partial [Candidatus Thermoplasmatota archaeon]|nr:ABC transporter ATP-binding protein [Candidatus Thermoplasmatota archaeon]